MENNKELVVIVEQSGIEKSEGQQIIDSFSSLYQRVGEWHAEASKIQVTDVEQVDEIKKAREFRLEGKHLRLSIENMRKGFKEGYLKKGKAVDMIAKYVSKDLEKLEDELERQEKFAITKKANEQEEFLKNRLEDRITRIKPFEVNIFLHDIKGMSDESFEDLYSLSKSAFEAKEARENAEKEEKDRIEKEKEAENERIRIENTKLKEDADKKAEIDRIEAERIAEEKKVMDEKHQAELRVQENARKKAEDELREKNEAEAREKAREEEERKAKEEAERQASLAPDKEKMTLFAENIRNIALPTGLSDEMQKLALTYSQKLIAISDEIKANLSVM